MSYREIHYCFIKSPLHKHCSITKKFAGVIHLQSTLSYYPICVGYVPRKRPNQFPEEAAPSKRECTTLSSN